MANSTCYDIVTIGVGIAIQAYGGVSKSMDFFALGFGGKRDHAD